MAVLRRVKGTLLSAFAGLSGTGPVRRFLWNEIAADMNVAALADLTRGRRALDPGPGPIAARPPRQWNDAQLDVPSTSRPTCRAMRRAYRSGEITPSDVLDKVIDRIEAGAFGAAHHSPFVALDFDRARRAAADSTRRYSSRGAFGFLDGAPVPIKDHHHMVGLRTGVGTERMGEAATEDASMITRLREGGAALFAKTATTEFGMDPCGMNDRCPMPRNAYSSDRGAGGSSTGSAVAVALGFCNVASASDGGGSIRVPAALNGIFGLKPSFIRISTGGDLFRPTSLSHTGCVGQSTCDLVDFLTVTGAEPDPQDELTMMAKDSSSVASEWRRALGRGVRGARIGVVRSEFADAPGPLAQLGLDALSALEQDGAQLVDVAIPLAPHAQGIGGLIIGAEVLGFLGEVLDEQWPFLGDGLRVLINGMRGMSARDYMIAVSARIELRHQVAAVLRDVDLLAMPSTACLAPHYPLDETGVSISDRDAIGALTRFTFLGNLTGIPAASVPVGMQEGLPVGLQLLSDAWDEASVIAAMAHVERLQISELPRPPGFVPLIDVE